MTCEELDGRLDDYVDGLLNEGEFQEVELHLASCAACREEERRLRLILAHAHALPRELAPGRDLWDGIRERIQAERRARSQGWLGLAAAAILVVGLSAALLSRTGPPPVGPRVVATPVSLRGGDTSLGAAEQDYQKAAGELLAVLQDRRSSLSPEAIASVERNLAVMDQALTEVRAALVRDPGNAELTRMLVSTHRKRVDTLRRVVRLSTAL